MEAFQYPESLNDEEFIIMLKAAGRESDFLLRSTLQGAIV